MKNHYFRPELLVGIAVLLAGVLPARPQTASSSGTVPVQMVVTLEARHGAEVPEITRDDVMVYQGRNRDRVTEWTPFQGEHPGLELFLAIDEACSTSIGSQLDEIRQFINSQPAATSIGIAYMRNGMADVLQKLTGDHAQAAKALRLPLGDAGLSASPYQSVVDLIKRWPGGAEGAEGKARREVLMISDGVDRLGGGGPADPYVASALEQIQRAGVTIYAIYANTVGHYGHTFWRLNWGQNYLSQVTDETGGEAYFMGLETPISFSPYLDTLAQRLNHQYLLGFLARPGQKSGLQKVELRTEVSNAELVAADKVWVPVGGKGDQPR
jgi:hypothetical protein